MGKQNPYDHSIRMPLIMSGPGIPKDRRVDDMVYMQSVYPTTCELAELEVPSSVEFASVRELATGASDDGGESVIFGTYLTSQRLVRTQTHKLIYYPKINQHQLFDLAKDPDEITNRYDDPDYAEVKEKLAEALAQTRMQLGDGLLGQRPRVRNRR